jgi:hypothetical protein
MKERLINFQTEVDWLSFNLRDFQDLHHFRQLNVFEQKLEF